MPADRRHTAAHDWLDTEAGPVVRPYALTGGRARANASIDLLAYVVAVEAAPLRSRYVAPEHRRILEVARVPTSVAELASHLNLALGVVRVILSDLIGEGLITMHEPKADAADPDTATLEAVIHVLRAL